MSYILRLNSSAEEYEQDEFQRELEAATYDYAERNYDEELDETYQDYEIMGMSFSAWRVASLL